MLYYTRFFTKYPYQMLLKLKIFSANAPDFVGLSRFRWFEAEKWREIEIAGDDEQLIGRVLM